MTTRSYFAASIREFLATSDAEILGHLSQHSEFAIESLQRNAWIEQIKILKHSLQGITGQVLLEYAIPRMGKRADVVLLLRRLVAVLELAQAQS